MAETSSLFLDKPLVLRAPGTVGSQTIPESIYLPIVVRQATPMPTSTVAPIPTATATPIAAPTALQYVCSYDYYNCPNFDTGPEAQEVFNYCRNLGFGDIHRLDQNDDGIACNALWP